jgi:uncharacterized protein
MTKPELKEIMKQAMRDKDSVTLTAVRNILSAIMNESINLGRGPDGELTSDEIIALIRLDVKRMKSAIEQFIVGGRPDLAEDNLAEVAVLEKLLPALMPMDAIRALVAAKADETGHNDVSKSGQLVGALMKDLAGLADGSDVKNAVSEFFAAK